MNKDICVLFREDSSNHDEFKFCKDFLITKTRRSLIPPNNLVIGRYSVLPFYKELEDDIYALGSKLINSYDQHKYIADFQYYEDIKDFTFKTFFNGYDLPEDKYVVKGATNSRKHEWDTMMYAPNKRRAMEIYCDLKNDSLIRCQDIIFRKYVPLETLEYGLNNLPITNEWRLFFLGDRLVDFDFYWSCIEQERVKSLIPDFGSNGIPFAFKVAKIIAKKINFFVIDIAKTESGEWVLVECNDAQMSGLNSIEPELFYFNLMEKVNDFKNV